MFVVSPTVTAITECRIRGVIDTHLYNVFDKTVGNLIYVRNGKKSPSLRSSLVFLRWVFHVTFYFILHIKFPLNIFTRHWFVFSGFEYSTYNSAPHVPKTYKNEGISYYVFTPRNIFRILSNPLCRQLHIVFCIKSSTKSVK